MSFIGGALISQLVDALKSPAAAGSSTEQLSVYVGEVASQLVDVARGQLWLDVQEHGAWLGNQARARQIGKDLEQLAGDQDWMWHHLVTVILPRTNRFLIGYVWSKGIVPLRGQLAKDEKLLRFLMGWRGQIDHWRQHTVDPELASWLEFHHWFNVNAAPPISTLAGWLRNPGTFAKWAVPILTDPIVVYLATRARQATVDELSALVADVSPDVWRHWESAAAAILNVEV